MCKSSYCCFFLNIPCSIRARAPSPVTLHAVPKLSCKANIAITKPTPVASKPNTDVMMPIDAATVPPGTPGAPTANMPKSTINSMQVWQ